MKKTNLLLCMLFGAVAYGQVGVNTTSPKSTLDVRAKATDGSTSEGIIVPKLTGDALFAAIAAGKYGSDQHSTIVYVTAPATNLTSQTTQVDAIGFYYFDSDDNQWKKLGSSSNIYNSNGTLSSIRHVTMAGNNLGFTGGRIGMGTTSPHPSAILDLTSTTLGFLLPRMSKAQMDAIAGPALGLQIYCTDCFGVDKGCVMVNDSPNPMVPNWGSMCSTNISTGVIDDLQCINASTSGSLHSGIAVSGVQTTVPYSGGHSGTYFSGSFNSTGVTGLVAHLPDGFISGGNGTLLFDIMGTPSGAGTASFNVTVGGKTCTFTVDVDNFTASVVSIDCGNAAFSPASIVQGQPYTGTLTIPYVGGNGDSYPQQQFTQNGLTFTLPAGTVANGSGNFVYNVSGTAASALTMSIPISFGNQNCNVSKTVTTGGGGASVVMCGSSKAWSSYNLGADTSLDPHTPVKGIHGNYYQWGRLDPVANADTPAGAISGWNITSASNGAWNSGTEAAPVKTAIDPCPSGFRVPTRNEWAALVNNTTSNTIGVFSTTNSGVSNFGAARQFVCPTNGNKLTLPASGNRYSNVGTLDIRGNSGSYWSSTENSTNAYHLAFNSSTVNAAYTNSRAFGFSVRCIAE
ncbi:hypothetical protein D1631_18725 [Chryseobacterium nematophagum]|uniref:Fibrobacter succinogenes major paralogous domain-containing protein n=1 Tax=Chryseobacterium nematophagum TaxID=2305228 RepID=A0A3M7TC93_9FLAO|nr:FISUMP domain-containing protein [Chryseobacterium nematophagum]RNA60437.1 hypothetical protein D1631_18235 [Chryseobacterium nematophagum]RNA60521.1 hypothetical protein D1631_18725 [Chryseobacterium nematophagum]